MKGVCLVNLSENIIFVILCGDADGTRMTHCSFKKFEPELKNVTVFYKCIYSFVSVYWPCPQTHNPFMNFPVGFSNSSIINEMPSSK